MFMSAKAASCHFIKYPTVGIGGQNWVAYFYDGLIKQKK